MGVPTGSVGRTGRPAGRRSIALFVPSSSRSAVQGRPVDPARRAHGRPDHTRAPPLRIRAHVGSCTVAFLPRGVPLPVHGPPARPGRASRSFPRPRPTALMGFTSALRRFDPAGRVASTSPWNRARVPFVPPRPPRLIFVGVTHRPSHRGDPAERWVRDEDASTSGLRSRLRSESAALSLSNCGSILPWAFPLSGLAGTTCRASRWSRHHRRSPASGASRRSIAVAPPLSAHGFRGVLPVTTCTTGVHETPASRS